MKFRATHKYARIAPRKTRYVIDLIRGNYESAIEIFRQTIAHTIEGDLGQSRVHWEFGTLAEAYYRNGDLQLAKDNYLRALGHVESNTFNHGIEK